MANSAVTFFLCDVGKSPFAGRSKVQSGLLVHLFV